MQVLQEIGGKPSLIRWLAIGQFIVGLGMIVAGLVGWFRDLPGATVIIGSGAGLIVGGGLEKALQKRFEGGK